MWLALAACGAPAPEAPSIARVEDHAGLLTPAAERRIEAKLAQLERRTTDQVAVKTVTTLGGEPIEEVSLRTARTARLGQKGKDNGVLLFVAPTEKKVRIETGRGIAGILTDAEAGAIVREMVAAFRAGQMERGIEIGVQEIDRELSTDPVRPALFRGDEPWPA
ncbi:MAG: TPM domain-containing protein [Sphingomicrobium sp.]